jgi:hypothetical protein
MIETEEEYTKRYNEELSDNIKDFEDLIDILIDNERVSITRNGYDRDFRLSINGDIIFMIGEKYIISELSRNITIENSTIYSKFYNRLENKRISTLKNIIKTNIDDVYKTLNLQRKRKIKKLLTI